MKSQKYFLNANLKQRKSSFAGPKRGAHGRANGSVATAAENAIAAILARNLRNKVFDDVMVISSINC